MKRIVFILLRFLLCVLLCMLLCCCGKKEKPIRPAPDDAVLAKNHSILTQYCKNDEQVKELEQLLLMAYSSGKLDQVEIKSAYWEKHVPYQLYYSDTTYYNDYLVLEMADGMQIWSYYSYGSFDAITDGAPDGRVLAAKIE